MTQLVESLTVIPKVNPDDLNQFRAWLKAQHHDRRFNVGCVFTIDSHGQLRVCLHPKLVRSRVETSPLPEEHMTEANLLTLITLLPTDKALLSVTLQPLLCSDILHLATDRTCNWPLEGVNTHANCFGGHPPDHIDIVSVATCTPQPVQLSRGDQYRIWHSEFKDSFKRAASDDALARHHYAIFVLSNFRTIPGREREGGLSGAFVPFPGGARYPGFVAVSAYGRPKDDPKSENKWSVPEDGNTSEGWSSFGHLTSLNPFAIGGSAAACMLGFTVSRLPRDMTRWKPMPGLADFQLQVAASDAASKELVFSRREV